MMKQLLKIIFLLAVTVLASNLSSATDNPGIELASMDFEIKESGIAFFSIMLSNPDFSSDLSIPNFDSEILKVYTINNKELAYDTQNDTLIIHPSNQSNVSTITIELSSQKLTSKEGSNWRFDLTSLDSLNAENVIMSVTLPYNSTIRAHSEPAFISSENNHIIVEWFLSNELAKSVMIQYIVNSISESQIIVNEEEKGINNLILFGIVGLVIILTCMIITTKKLHNKEKAYVSDLLIGYEVEIVNLLRKSKKGLTQKRLQLESNIPKSTLSRTLRRLEVRNIITINNMGHQNLIVLKK
ncbi:hypothetical protein KJ708_08610 [bacterium]|nr:hypothetical protein [bacterium]MBU1917977.1 hypothetical protein [bacterium]